MRAEDEDLATPGLQRVQGRGTGGRPSWVIHSLELKARPYARISCPLAHARRSYPKASHSLLLLLLLVLLLLLRLVAAANVVALHGCCCWCCCMICCRWQRCAAPAHVLDRGAARRPPSPYFCAPFLFLRHARRTVALPTAAATARAAAGGLQRQEN